MSTPFTAHSEQLLAVIGPTSDSLTVQGTIPARSGMVIVIDWINGWCVNPSTGAGFGTDIKMQVTNDLGTDLCFAFDDGYAGAASELRSVYVPYWGGVPSVAAGAPGAPRVGQSVTATVTITGATNNAGNLNQLGASVGYHYELG